MKYPQRLKPFLLIISQRLMIFYQNQRGVSLIEVSFAILLLGFCLTTRLALVPLSLNIFRETRANTVSVFMGDVMASQALLTNPQSLSQPITLFFDDEGALVDSKEKATYIGTIKKSSSSPVSISSESLIQMIVHLDHRFDKKWHKEFTILVADK